MLTRWVLRLPSPSASVWKCRSRRVPPFVVEDGVHQGVPPAALDPLVLAEVDLPPHAELLQHAGRSGVVGDAFGPDAVQPEVAEADAEDGAGGLGGVATSPGARIELVADVALPPLGVVDADAAVADQARLRFADDDHLPDTTRLLRLSRDDPGDEVADDLIEIRWVGVEAPVAGIGPVGEHLRPIVLVELAQDQPLGLDLHRSSGRSRARS